MKLLLIGVFSVFIFGRANAQQPVDYTALIKATQSQQGVAGELKLAWWIPVEFWEQALLQQGVTGFEIQSFLDVLEPYVFVGMIDGAIGDYGTVSYMDEKIMSATLRVTGTSGEQRTPLDPEEIPEELDYMLSLLKPMLQGMMGEMGANFHFYVFSDEMTDGTRFCDPFATGSVKIETSRSNHSIRTPLGPLLPPKVCPEDEEEFMGDYNFCPYCGHALEDK